LQMATFARHGTLTLHGGPLIPRTRRNGLFCLAIVPLQSRDPFSLCSPMLHIIPQIVTSEFSASVSQVKALVAPAAGAGSGESDAALSAGQAKAAAILAAQLAAEALLPEAEVRLLYVGCCARGCLGGGALANALDAAVRYSRGLSSK
jgi:hypothetical protein